MSTDLAYLSARTGRAFVTARDGKFALRVGDPEPHKCEDSDVANFLSLTRDATTVMAGSFPFSEVAIELQRRWTQARALDLFISTVDPLLPSSVRRESARHTELLLSNSAVIRAIRRVFLNAPIPPAASVLIGAGLANELGARVVARELQFAFELGWCISGVMSRWQDVDKDRESDEFTRVALIFGRFAEAVLENRSFEVFADEAQRLVSDTPDVGAVIANWLTKIESLYRLDARYVAAVKRRVASLRVRAEANEYLAHWAMATSEAWPVAGLLKNDDGTWSLGQSTTRDFSESFCFAALPVRTGEESPYAALALVSSSGAAFAEVDENNVPLRVLSREVGALQMIACAAVDDLNAAAFEHVTEDVDYLMVRSHTPMRTRIENRLQALLRSRRDLLARDPLTAKTSGFVSWRPFEARLVVLMAALIDKSFAADDPRNAKTVQGLAAAVPRLPLRDSAVELLDRLVDAWTKHKPLDPDEVAVFVQGMWRTAGSILPPSIRRTFVPLLDHATKFLADAAETSVEPRQILELHHAEIVAHLMISRMKYGSEADTLSSRLGNTARAMTRADHLRFFEDRIDRIDAGMLNELGIAVQRTPTEPIELLKVTENDAKWVDPTLIVTSAGIVFRYAAQTQYDILNQTTEALALLQRATVYFATAAAMPQAKDKWLYTHWARAEALRGRILARVDREAAVAAFASAQNLASHDSIKTYPAEIAAMRIEHVGTDEQIFAETEFTAKTSGFVSWRPFEARLVVLMAALIDKSFAADDPRNAKTVQGLAAAVPRLPLRDSAVELLDRLVDAWTKHKPLDPDEVAVFVQGMWRTAGSILPPSIRRTFVPLLDHATKFLADAAETSVEPRQILELHHAEIVAHLMISRMKYGSEADTLSSRLGNTARAMTRADHLRFFEDRIDRIDAGMLNELGIAVQRTPTEPIELLKVTENDAKWVDPTLIVTSAGIVFRYAAQTQYDILNQTTEALALLQRATVYFATAAAMPQAKDKWLYTHWARAEALRGRILARVDREAAVAAFASAQNLASHDSIKTYDSYAWIVHRAEIAAMQLEHVSTQEQMLEEMEQLIDELTGLTATQPEHPSAWNVLCALYEVRGDASAAVAVLDRWAGTWANLPSRGRAVENVRYRAAELAMRIARNDADAIPMALQRYIALLADQPGNVIAMSEFLSLLKLANDDVKSKTAAFAADHLPRLNTYDCKTTHAVLRIVLLEDGTDLTSIQTLAQALAAFINGPASLRDEAQQRIVDHWTPFLGETLEYLTREVFDQMRATLGAPSREVHPRLDRVDALLDICLSHKPSDAIWLTRKADIALVRGPIDPSALAERLLQAAPDDAIIRLKAAQLMMRGGLFSEADAILSDPRRKDSHPAVLDRRALLATLRGDFEVASDLYNELLTQNALDSAALWGYGRLAVELRDLAGAFGAWLRALRVRCVARTSRDVYLGRRTSMSLAALYRESGGALPDIGAGIPSLYMRAIWEEPASVACNLIEALGTAGLTDRVTMRGVIDATDGSADSGVTRQVAQYLMTSTIDGALRPDADLGQIQNLLALAIDWTQERRVFGDFIAGAKREYARAILRHGWHGEMPIGFDADVTRNRLTVVEQELLNQVSSTAYSPDYYQRAYRLSAKLRRASDAKLNDFVLLLVYSVADRIRELSAFGSPLQRVSPANGINLVSINDISSHRRLTVSGDADALGELARRFAIGAWRSSIDAVDATIDRAPTLVESHAFANFGVFFREAEATHQCYLSRLMGEAA